MLRAGELREKIVIQAPIRTEIGGGAYETTYTQRLATYAMVVEERSNPNLVGSQENIQNYVHFKIRYRPQIEIKIGDRIVWRDFNFIVNNIKVSGLRTQIDIFVNSEMETSNRGEPIVLNTFDNTFDATFN